MTEHEADLLDDIMADILAESPTLKRLYEESPYREMGGNFLIFTYKNYKLKLWLKIMSKLKNNE